MTKDQLKQFIRVQIEDTVKPYHLDDDDLNTFLKEAEREAFERAYLGRIDSNITLVANQATYNLNDVIELTRVKVSGEASPLVKTTKRELDFEIGAWDAQAASMPKYYFQQGDTITLYPKPDAVGTLLLDGFRYPYYDMETPANLHESLAYWPMYRFYSIPDSDTHDPVRAQFFEDKFTKVFGHKKSQQFISAWRDNSHISSMNPNPFN